MNEAEKTFKIKETISESEFAPGFASAVLAHPDAQGLNACFSCGACSAGCPIHEVFPDYSPKKLAKMVKLGMRKMVLSSPYIWYCATCRNCVEHCPQNVKFFDILNVLKNMAAQEGYAPAAWVEQTKQVMETGIVFAREDSWLRKRENLALRPLKAPQARIKEIIKETEIGNIKPNVDAA